MDERDKAAALGLNTCLGSGLGKLFKFYQFIEMLMSTVVEIVQQQFPLINFQAGVYRLYCMGRL